MNTQQARSLVAIALMAAFADGRQDTEEREHVRKVAESLGRDIEIDFIPLYQDVLLGRLSLDAAVAAQDHKNLEALAHLVKGAAGYVQAKALTHSADALERQANRGDAAAMERLAFTFRSDLTAVLEVISDRLKRQADAAAKQLPVELSQPVAGTDAQKALVLIEKAEPLMQKGDYAATALLADLAQELQGHPASAKLEEVRVLYEDIELNDALMAMGQLRQLLGAATDTAVEDQG